MMKKAKDASATPKMDAKIKKLFTAAHKAQFESHSPYSHKKIGAAILLTNGEVFTGCNIENASFGATVCAERVGIWKAISKNKKSKIKEVLVISDANPPWPPCGMCRQVIAEFASSNVKIHAANPNGEITTYKFSDLFPSSFGPQQMKK